MKNFANSELAVVIITIYFLLQKYTTVQNEKNIII